MVQVFPGQGALSGYFFSLSFANFKRFKKKILNCNNCKLVQFTGLFCSEHNICVMSRCNIIDNYTGGWSLVYILFVQNLVLNKKEHAQMYANICMNEFIYTIRVCLFPIFVIFLSSYNGRFCSLFIDKKSTLVYIDWIFVSYLELESCNRVLYFGAIYEGRLFCVACKWEAT